MLRIFQGVFWIEDIEGYPNLDSYFAFNYLVCVWECIEVEQKNTVLQSSQVQGLLWTSLTSAINVFNLFHKSNGSK